MLKDLGVDDELEVISVDINDSMNVTYSRYYLDFPWLMVDISNLLLRQSLIQDYYTSTTVPQLVLLNRFGEIVDSSTIEKIENFLNDKLISLETIYPDRQSHDYEVYNAYNNEETIPALTNHLSTSRTLSAENDRRQDSFEDNKNIIAPQTRPLSVDMTRSKPNSSDNGVTTSDRDSVRKSNNPLSKIVNSIYGEGGAVSTSSEQQQPARYSLQNASVLADAKQDRRIELKPLATAITAPETVKTFQSASNDTVSSVDTIRVKQLLRQLPTLPKFPRGKTYVESAILFYIINARKEVDMLDIIINELLEQQQKYYPSYRKDIIFNNKKMIGYGIIDMKDSIRNYERIITKFTYNEHFPSFSLGYPSIKWEKDLITELHITHSHWEHRLQSLYYHEHDETANLLTQLQLQYQEEYWRYCLELLQWCKVERIEREAIARRFEFFAIVIVCVIGLCIPVIVGVVIGVYAK